LFGGDTPGTGYHGYYFKILKAQGTQAKDDAFSYILGNKLSGGFALVAWPVSYNDTGIMTFMINYNGVLYEKNLGSKTDHNARSMNVFNPDDSWTEVTQ
jgi:hypothetical protein|tara:strand:+ start:216 stop:512 length:297 start_codon:yes stop_codon:yes gene_type:complete